MSFFKLFRSKKGEKEVIPDEEEEPIRRMRDSYGGSRREKRGSRIRVSVDDTFVKPTDPYHTATHSRPYKPSRSCIGRDEYEKHRHNFDAQSYRGSTKFGKRSNFEKKYGREHELPYSKMPYEAELFDSDESAGSAERRENGEAMQALESRMETLTYRLRKEEERKNSYKQKLISERIIRQHVEAKFVEDIQRLKQLVESLKNEQKAYKNRIALLEAQLKRLAPQMVPFKGSSLFSPSTSNPHALVTSTDLVCSVTSDSTAPPSTSLHCNSLNDDVADEVKNFRINEVSTSVEIGRNGCKRPTSGSSFSRGSDTANLEETLLGLSVDLGQARTIPMQAAMARRTSSDTNLKGMGGTGI